MCVIQIPIISILFMYTLLIKLKTESGLSRVRSKNSNLGHEEAAIVCFRKSSEFIQELDLDVRKDI